MITLVEDFIGKAYMVDFKKACINYSSSALEALEVINSSNHAYIALVVDDSNLLIGTITDGDIRRGLLKGKTLEAKATDFMNRNFDSIDQREVSKSLINQKFKNGINQLPVIDNEGKIVGLIMREGQTKECLSTKPNSVVIMAGGKGSRLKPHTNNCPKPMLHVNGKPIIEIIIRNCIDFGLTKFFISVNYLKEQIINHLGDGSTLGVDIEYLYEDMPLGTAGSLHLLPKDIKETILILNGDVLTNLNLHGLINFHQENNADITLCAREESTLIPYGVIKLDGINVEELKEKPIHSYLVNAGIYLINPGILRLIESNSYLDMPNLILKAKKNGSHIIAFPIHEYWIDVGRPETLKQAHNEWSVNDNI
ncbi:nucleotidyltransferase family protein [Prochlorococcus marinus]|nr:nucleotidyltransferase family protein [Prochlorococcus marinus]